PSAFCAWPAIEDDVDGMEAVWVLGHVDHQVAYDSRALHRSFEHVQERLPVLSRGRAVRTDRDLESVVGRNALPRSFKSREFRAGNVIGLGIQTRPCGLGVREHLVVSNAPMPPVTQGGPRRSSFARAAGLTTEPTLPLSVGQYSSQPLASAQL